jgi:predicted lactoylglutathione lyase
MLLTEAHFKKFTHKELVDAKITNEVLTALSLESREEVDEIHDKAIAAGGKLHREDDLGFMYTKAIEDLDGHVWEFFYMDISKMPTE